MGVLDTDSTTAYGAHFGGGMAGLLLAPLFVKSGVQVLARPVEDAEHAFEYDEGFVVPRWVAAVLATLLLVTLVSLFSNRQDSVGAAETAKAREWVALARIEGIGVPQDTQRGLALYRVAATQDPEIATHLADTLREGKTVPKDEMEAAQWYRRAAEQKEPKAVSAWALMLVDGGIVPRDRARGLALLQQLADEGYSSADLQLGQLLEAGRGGAAPDLAGAVQHYKHGCDNRSTERAMRAGRTESCQRYAKLLKEGRGIDADPDKAAEVLKQLDMDRILDAGIDAILNRRR
jgi:TPR repeat protein